MDKQKIIDYILETPGNNNPAVLNTLLDEYGGGSEPTGTIEITENGIIDVEQYANANVNVEPIINSVTITENGTYEAIEGVDGYNPITVNVPSGGYSETLLWENPNPLNEFSSTFNIVSYNIIKEYDYFIITCATEGPSGEILETTKSELYEISNTPEQYIHLFSSGINEYSNFWYSRQLVIFNYDPGIGDGIMIDDCIRVNSGSTKYNTQMIPYKIYGVKLG